MTITDKAVENLIVIQRDYDKLEQLSDLLHDIRWNMTHEDEFQESIDHFDWELTKQLSLLHDKANRNLKLKK
jgi:hypothetical protein